MNHDIFQQIQKEANKYHTRNAFKKGSPREYNSARRRKILDKVCYHMKNSKTAAYTFEELKEEALKYTTRTEFQENNQSAYRAACKTKILDKICAHMKDFGLQAYSFEELKNEALKYNDRMEFQEKSRSAYVVSWKRNILDQICSHMKPSTTGAYDLNELKKEASKYRSRMEFSDKKSAAYEAARKMGVLDQICFHMKSPGSFSAMEKELSMLIEKLYPNTRKLIDRKVSIKDKPHIKGFEIDIYIPELKRGIEFDGTYYHSINGLKRTRPHWPNEDIENYHQIKDEWFASKGIRIIHIKEENWKTNKKACLQTCLNFISLKQ